MNPDLASVRGSMQYILEMRTLIAEIKAGRAREEKVNFHPYLDTTFISGEATITGNQADAEMLEAEQAGATRANRSYSK